MKKLIVANWKMNPENLKQAQKMLASLKTGLKNSPSAMSRAEVAVCPPFVYLGLGAKAFGGKIKLGAQNCFWENSGQYTGEVSPKMLKSLGVKYVVLGHSERRLVMAETTEQVNKKIKASLKAGLAPIVCFGESLEEKKQEKSFVAIEQELREMASGIARPDFTKIIFAYEPDWAIGTGNNCTPDDVLTTTLFVKKLFSEIHGRKIGQAIRVLYGGSVQGKNAKAYLENEAVAGLLVGGASLNVKEFIAMVKDI